MSNKFEVFIVTSTKLKYPVESGYTPLLIRAFEDEKNRNLEGYIWNDTGDNIAHKQYQYTEFTCNYWMWKNTHSEIIGLNHYRRYFVEDSRIKYLHSLVFPYKRKYLLTEDKVNSIFNKGYNCILPKKKYLTKSVKEAFEENHGTIALAKSREIIEDKFPEYLETFDTVMNGNTEHQRTIFIMTRDMFNSYSNFIFTIFSSLERYVPEYRVLGHTGERLLNVWVEYNKKNGLLNVKETYYILMPSNTTSVGQIFFETHHHRWTIKVVDVFYRKIYVKYIRSKVRKK